MDKEEILKKTEEYVKTKLYGEGSGHDWWHIYRVRKLALRIAKEEDDIDLFVVELAALLHDIADWKFNEGNASIGSKKTKEWLEKNAVDEKTISHVCSIVEEVDFKGVGVESRPETREGMIVQDADKLDAIGAIGIARTFTYGGHKNREIYNPEIKPKKHKTFEEYKRSTGPTINHFYEKLLLLRDRMNTETAKKIAEKRHKFMEEFLDRFFEEWEGKD